MQTENSTFSLAKIKEAIEAAVRETVELDEEARKAKVKALRYIRIDMHACMHVCVYIYIYIYI